MLLSFRVCRARSKGRRLGIVCIFIEFQIVDLSLMCKQYYAWVMPAWSSQNHKQVFFFNLLRTASIYSRTIFTRIVSAGKKKVPAAVSSHSVWRWTQMCVCKEGERGRERGERSKQRGQSSHRRAPQPKGQLSTAGGEENNGASARAVWKKDESGSLSISTACRHCSEPRGLRGGGRRRCWASGRRGEKAGNDPDRLTEESSAFASDFL